MVIIIFTLIFIILFYVNAVQTNSYFSLILFRDREQTTTKISYTLKDNDPANLLSIDIINSFDGNGPLFITQGGRTSCPYEGAEVSKFFTEEKYNAYFTSYFDITKKIDDNQKTYLIMKRNMKNYRIMG